MFLPLNFKITPNSSDRKQRFNSAFDKCTYNSRWPSDFTLPCGINTRALTYSNMYPGTKSHNSLLSDIFPV